MEIFDFALQNMSATLKSNTQQLNICNLLGQIKKPTIPSLRPILILNYKKKGKKEKKKKINKKTQKCLPNADSDKDEPQFDSSTYHIFPLPQLAIPSIYQE